MHFQHPRGSPHTRVVVFIPGEGRGHRAVHRMELAVGGVFILDLEKAGVHTRGASGGPAGARQGRCVCVSVKCVYKSCYKVVLIRVACVGVRVDGGVLEVAISMGPQELAKEDCGGSIEVKDRLRNSSTMHITIS